MDRRFDFTVPLIADLQTGSDFLANLPLANPAAAEQALIRFLDCLLAAPPDPGILFSLLERSRAPLSFVEEEMARRYHNKPLLLTEEDDGCFQQVAGVWRRMAKAYALCAAMERPDTGNAMYAALVATLLHRCLYYTGMIVVEHYRARRELPPGLWLELHGYYASAEEWGVAYTPVEDALENSLQATHCAAAYTALLLIDVASPYGNSVRSLALIRRWATLWAPLVSLHALDSDLELPPYIVELMKDAPLHPSATIDEPGTDARRLDTTQLGFQINHMISQLHQRVSPSQLGLGEEGNSHVLQLLEHLLRPWTQAASPRRFRRFATNGAVRVALGFEAMHFFVTGCEFEQPDSAQAYSRGEFDQLFTFRDRAAPGQVLSIKPQIAFPFDEWTVINHSANGFRLARSSAGQKLSHGQLLALCPHDGEHFLLAQVCWLMQEQDGGLVAGLASLPGMPKGIGLRPAVTNAAFGGRFVPAFLLPPLPAIAEEGSLVVPSGLYQASAPFEICGGDGPDKVRLKHILQRGVDFDRVSYESL